MSENKSKKTKRAKKCKVKCATCEFYDTPLDYCSQKGIEECSKQAHTDFSACEDYLIRENLVMFGR